jgi:carboxymethylenebutenolidase
MKQIALPLLLLLLSVSSAFAGGSMIQFPSGSEQINAYLSKPSEKGPFPALILIHEWWGLNDQIKGIADRFAKEGYVAIAVDLYRGKVATTSEDAHQYMAGLPEDRAVNDLRAAFAYLQQQESVHKDRIGSTGWCMGGGYSLQLALHEPQLAACVMFYGRPVLDVDTLKAIKAPVIGFFGAEDKGIPPESAKKFEEQMKTAGKSIEIHIYPGAGHAFFNETQPSYNAVAAKDAWSRALAFFGEHLKK